MLNSQLRNDDSRHQLSRPRNARKNAFWLAYIIRFELSLGIFYQNLRTNMTYYQGLVILLIPTWLLIFYLLRLYDRQKLLGGTQEYALLFNGSTIGIVTVIAAGFLEPEFVFARGWLLLAWIFAFLFTALGRFTLRRVVYALRKQGYFLTPAVIIGANNEGISLAEQLMMWKSSGLHILGFIDKKFPVGTSLVNRLPVLGTVDDLDGSKFFYGLQELRTRSDPPAEVLAGIYPFQSNSYQEFLIFDLGSAYRGKRRHMLRCDRRAGARPRN